MGDLLWWPYGQKQINSDIKEAIARSETAADAEQGLDREEGQEARDG